MLREYNFGDCLICGAENVKNRCKRCEKEFMCNDCRQCVFRKFRNGRNHQCLTCQLTQPIYMRDWASFALHRPAEITEELRDLYGPIIPITE